MVNAQEYINKNFSPIVERIDIRNQQLEGWFDLSAYKNLKELYLINCGLTNYNFLRTIPNKGKLRELNLGNNSEQWKNNFDNHEGSSYQGLIILICRFFPNLEYASLDGVPVKNPEWIIIKPLAFLPYCHTFLIDNHIGWGYEFTTINLNKLRGDEEANREFINWRRNNWTWINSIQKDLVPEKELEWKRQQHLGEKETELQQISTLLFPHQPYSFPELEAEVKRLKIKEMSPQVRSEKAKFEQLITNAKNKADKSEKVIDLLLETQRQINENKWSNDQLTQSKLKGQLNAYQEILKDSLTKEEIQSLLDRQTEFHHLEEHLARLQINEQKVQIPPK